MREFLGVKSRDANDEVNQKNEKIDEQYHNIKNNIEQEYQQVSKTRL